MSSAEHRIRGDLTVILSAVDTIRERTGSAADEPAEDIRAAVRRITRTLGPDDVPADGTAATATAVDDLRVLCVDDDEDNLALLRVVLAGAGVRTVQDAASAAAALTELATDRYDVVVVDWHLGAASAEDLVLEIGRRDRAPAVLVLTGDPGARPAALAAGAHQIALKPVDIDELLDRMASALAARREAG